MSNSASVPVGTYRVQFDGGFGFDAAAGVADYLAQLGVSHLYASPYFQTPPQGGNAYAIANFKKVSEQLGGVGAHTRMIRALKQNGLGQVLDIVPNHMAVGTRKNLWWWDVLQHGQYSPYACYFDVDWDAPEARLHGKVMLPVLADHFGRVIEAGKIHLARNGASFTISCAGNEFPLAPSSLSVVLTDAAARYGQELLVYLAEMFDEPLAIPRTFDAEAVRAAQRQQILLKQLASLLESDREAADAVEAAVAHINADPDAMEALLRRQHYRLAYWRAGIHELNYRRFFNIDTLIGICAENERVFDDTHEVVLKWVRDGDADGLRVDHVDGLRDPEQYLRRLRQAAPSTWITVEKILLYPERLPESWPVAGTTGYDFLNRVSGIFIEPGGEEALSRLYGEFTHESSQFKKWLRDKKAFILGNTFGGELNRLANIFVDICEEHRRFRDYTRYELHEALAEIIVCLPVYRAYARPEAGTVSPQDVQFVEQAVTEAKELRSDIDARLLDFLRDILLLRVRGDSESSLVSRFQQLTGPVMAKGIEDTAFYCYNRLISLNEVGGDPDKFGWSVEEFHDFCIEMQEHWPAGMITTATHDTKRGEDARLRIGMLSEIPERWTEAVWRWAEINNRYRTGGLPERNAEYMLYQTLVGTWPLETERALGFMAKASREAKTYTSWIDPDPEYDAALRNFVSGALGDESFQRDLGGFVAPIIDATYTIGLSQALIKMTAPGIPDIYQGCELWDTNLVDPDNRRPVDYAFRRVLLKESSEMSPEDIWARRDTGMPKMHVLRRALQLRRDMPEPFSAMAGQYTPIQAQGAAAGHVIAFMRGGKVITVVPRLMLCFENWDDTSLTLPNGRWRNVLTGDEIDGGAIPVSTLFNRFPAALLATGGH
jgi:(1->4)-alpha-D-glucan 1-alpha-D-glucosylmutase